jgi:DNA polymerase bacteriophage-type
MQTLAIDIETFSSIDIVKCGMYKYVESPDFEIMLFAYSFNGQPVQVIDLTDLEELPMEIKNALTDENVKKTAWNAQFERRCIEKFFKIHLPIDQWECTMVKASMLGLPLSLDAAGKALQLENGKMADGKALIRYFCCPCKPTKTNNQRIRNYAMHAPDKWQRFKEYCAQDVVTERTIGTKISFFEIPEAEKRLYILDQQINDRGVMLDPVLVTNAIRIDLANRERLTKEAVELTGLGNPNSVAQLKEWISKEMDEEVGSLNKKDIPAILAKTDNAIVQKVLELRQEMSKTSVKKYVAMHNATCNDNRVRGLLQMYGANRTGRWAGRLVQVQNLPKNEMPDLELARQVIRSGDLECLELMYSSVSDVLKQLIRTAFIAPEGHRLIAADFSAIEARVIAWLAGEKWRINVFNTHGKIYEASASQMFKVPISSITKGSDLRQRGKVSELALGYQGAVNALLKMGALEMGLKEEELPKLVAMWRQANPMIVKFWKTCEDAAIEAVENRSMTGIQFGIKFFIEKGILFIQLPSGRRLSYLKPRLVPNKFGGKTLTYEGMDQTTKKWGTQETYGGKIVENIVQATARDVLADAMLRLNKALYTIVMHVHDETVMDMPARRGSTEEVNRIMGEPIGWAKGLPLKAESYETMFYKKD